MTSRMKKILAMMAVAAIAAVAVTSCQKEFSYNDETPTVTMSTSASEFVLDQAQITLTLSHFIHKDVNVTFEMTGLEAEAIDLPEVYTIEAGAIKKVITLNVDEEKATLGNKQVGISITEAENAVVNASASQVSIGINIEDVAIVNMSATELDANLEATINFTLSKAVTKDVVLTLGYDTKDGAERAAFPEASISYDKTVTIPSGSKKGSVKVAASKAGVEEGAYQAHFTIANYGSNAKAGTSAGVTILVNVGFQPTLLSTDDARIIYTSGWLYVYYDYVHPYYFIWNEPKTAGDASDMDYVKAAMYRCRDWVKDAGNAAAWLAYWSAFAGYEAYVPNGCPQLTANKTGYWGWPMIMINEGAIEDLDEVVYGDGSYHAFLVGFDENQDLMETYQYTSFDK